MIMGPVFQIIYYLLIFRFLTMNELELFKNYHYSILFFNLLPIYPLDGGKLLNIIINYFISFRRSFRLTIFISYMCIVTIGYFFIYKNISISFSIFLIALLVICKLTNELKKERFYFNKFLLERHINDYKFPKIKVIKDLQYMSRDYKHVIFKKGKTRSEKEELSNYFRQ